jgi:tetratricopeptide (TPR) repeat protein
MKFRYTRVVVLVAGLSVAAAGCGKYSINNIRALKAFKDATELYQRGDYRAAASDYERAIQLNPDWGFSYFYLGNSYDKLYKPARKGEAENDAYLPKAVENYRKAIEKLKDSPEPQAPQFRKLSYEYLVAAYGSDRLNDFNQAESVAKELIATEPDEPGNYQALARLYEDQGRMEDAEAMLKKSTEVKPNDPLGYQLLAAFYNRQGEFDKTIEAFSKRAEMEPNNPEAWHTMATFYYDKALRDHRLPAAKAKEYVQNGLNVEDKALALNGDYYEAITYKSMLLKLAANFETNGPKQKQLLAQADQLAAQSEEIHKKQEGAAAAAAAAAKKK